MKKKITFLAFVGGFQVTGALAQSYPQYQTHTESLQPQQQTEYITVPVRKVTPIVVEQEQMQEVCENRQQKAEKSGLGPLAGAVIGGIVGNQVGKGTGRALATGAGIIGGAIVGDRIEENTAKAHSQGECVKRAVWNQKLVGYDVEYDYKGVMYKTTTKRYPDKFMTLQVTTRVSVMQQD